MSGRASYRWIAGAVPTFLASPDRHCAVSDPDLFYSAQDTAQALARRICSGCPVRQECLEYAVDIGEEFGIWSGVLFSSFRERSAARVRVDLARRERVAA